MTSIYRVRHDFTKYQPSRWNASYVKLFGERNEGFTLDAQNVDDAKARLHLEKNLNPFYLTIELERAR